MDILTAINTLAFQYAGSVASQGLTVAMGYFAESYYLVLVAIALFLFIKKDKNVFAFAVATVILFVISDVLKMLIQEPRPCQVEIDTLSWLNGVCESGFAFPSNHATVLTGVYLFVKGYRYLNALYIVWLLIILFGRVYLGAHYLTDVVAGVIISLAVASIIYRYREQINSFGIRTLRPIFGEHWTK